MWSEVEDDLFKKMQTLEFVNSAVDNSPFIGMPKDIIREYIVDLFERREFSKFLVNQFRQAGVDKLQPKDIEAFSEKLGAELFLSLAIKGMARLDAADHKDFISFANLFLNYASVQDCKWMMTDGTTASFSERGKIESKYYSKFKNEELRLYLRFLRRSILAEINNFPNSRTINEDQMKIAEDAFKIVLEKKMKQQSVRIETLKAMTDMKNSSAKDVCDAGKLVFSSLLDMKGSNADVMITKFILSIR